MEMILIPKSSWVLSQITNVFLCTGLFCVYHRIYIPRSDHSPRAPMVFVLFVAASIFQVVFTVCKSQRFLFCLSPHLFSEWHIVPQLYIQIKQSRVHSRKALYECKASRRLGKQIRGLSRFLSKAHLAAPTIYPTTLTTTHI